MKKIPLILTSAVLSTLSAEAANIAWVSFHSGDNSPSANAAGAGFTQAPDIGYTSLLTANGHNVTRVLTADNLTTASPTISLLNTFDLVIVGRSVNSGHYETDAETAAWHSITAPTIFMGGYLLRNNRLGFTTGTSVPDTTTSISLSVSQPQHPIFAGISLDAQNVMQNPYAGIVTFNELLQRGISVNNNALAGGGTMLASFTLGSPVAAEGAIIAEWQAGAVMGTTPPDTLAGHRLVFLSGSRERDGVHGDTAGIFDLAADGQTMFLNAVNYMAVPEPSTMALAGLGALALLAKRRNA